MKMKVFEHIQSSDAMSSKTALKHHEQVVLDALRDILELCKEMDLRQVSTIRILYLYNYV